VGGNAPLDSQVIEIRIDHSSTMLPSATCF
jgi:hypothetical protein